MIYDKSQSFEHNVEKGPVLKIPISLPLIVDRKQIYSFLGYPVRSPLGIPACAIMTGKGIALMSKFGFSIFTYKTVRSHKSDAHPLPNICYIEGMREVTKEQIGSAIVEQDELQDNSIAFANSFGNNCFDWDWLQQDIAYARSCLGEDQVLIVSVYGTQHSDCSEAEDFVRAALLAQEAGAHVIELNFSCPNVKGVLLYKDATSVHEIAKLVVNAVSIPVIIKVGVFDNYEQMKATLIAAVRAGIQGVCGINTVPMRVINDKGDPVFGQSRAIAGISGNPVRGLGHDFVSMAHKIIKTERLNLTLLATGGVLAPIHIDEYLELGADVVMSATGAMWNPMFAYEWCCGKGALMNKENLILRLYEIGAIKFGNFTLKSGMQSPIYIDLRRIVSYPDVLRAVAQLLWEQVKNCNFDLICGVPYTALPIATAISLAHNKPMVMRRKEAKEYGTKQTIEGAFESGQTCLVVEDLFTTGSSALETIVPLEQAGLKVEHVVILIDRQQGGIVNVEKRGYFVHPVFTLTDIMDCLRERSIITQETVCEVDTYLKQHQKTI